MHGFWLAHKQQTQKETKTMTTTPLTLTELRQGIKILGKAQSQWIKQKDRSLRTLTCFNSASHIVNRFEDMIEALTNSSIEDKDHGNS